MCGLLVKKKTYTCFTVEFFLLSYIWHKNWKSVTNCLWIMCRMSPYCGVQFNFLLHFNWMNWKYISDFNSSQFNLIFCPMSIACPQIPDGICQNVKKKKKKSQIWDDCEMRVGKVLMVQRFLKHCDESALFSPQPLKTPSQTDENWNRGTEFEMRV